MANIQTYLTNILKAIYGEEVRGSIHDAISAINDDVNTANTTANTAKTSAAASEKAAKASAADAKASQEAAASSAQSAATTANTTIVNVTNAEAAAQAAQAAAEAAQKAAQTAQKNAKDSADAAASSAKSAHDDAATAREVAMGNIYGRTISVSPEDGTTIEDALKYLEEKTEIPPYATNVPLSETDDTKISEVLSALEKKTEFPQTLSIAFTNLSFLYSSAKKLYRATVTDKTISSKYKPGDLTLKNTAALTSSLEVETSDDGGGCVYFTLSAQPTVAFSGEILLHYMGES